MFHQPDHRQLNKRPSAGLDHRSTSAVVRRRQVTQSQPVTASLPASRAPRAPPGLPRERPMRAHAPQPHAHTAPKASPVARSSVRAAALPIALELGALLLAAFSALAAHNAGMSRQPEAFLLSLDFDAERATF